MQPTTVRSRISPEPTSLYLHPFRVEFESCGRGPSTLPFFPFKYPLEKHGHFTGESFISVTDDFVSYTIIRWSYSYRTLCPLQCVRPGHRKLISQLFTSSSRTDLLHFDVPSRGIVTLTLVLKLLLFWFHKMIPRNFTEHYLSSTFFLFHHPKFSRDVSTVSCLRRVRLENVIVGCVF